MAKQAKGSNKAYDERMRISLVFHMDDPLERAAYELMSSKVGKKSRSRMVSQAIMGMMFLNEDGILDVHTIQEIISKTVQTCIAYTPVNNMMEIQANESCDSEDIPDTIVSDDLKTSINTSSKESSLEEENSVEQNFAMDSIIDMFENSKAFGNN